MFGSKRLPQANALVPEEFSGPRFRYRAVLIGKLPVDEYIPDSLAQGQGVGIIRRVAEGGEIEDNQVRRLAFGNHAPVIKPDAGIA